MLSIQHRKIELHVLSLHHHCLSRLRDLLGDPAGFSFLPSLVTQGYGAHGGSNSLPRSFPVSWQRPTALLLSTYSLSMKLAGSNSAAGARSSKSEGKGIDPPSYRRSSFEVAGRPGSCLHATPFRDWPGQPDVRPASLLLAIFPRIRPETDSAVGGGDAVICFVPPPQSRLIALPCGI